MESMPWEYQVTLSSSEWYDKWLIRLVTPETQYKLKCNCPAYVFHRRNTIKKSPVQYFSNYYQALLFECHHSILKTYNNISSN